MKTFTGFEYLMIDAANAFGLDKATFEVRLEWAKQNFDTLEDLYKQAETPALYAKAVAAIRKAQNKVATGHLVGFDAACSGMQIMSVLMGCYSGAQATGLIHPDVRSDAYHEVTVAMNDILADSGHTTVQVSRKQAKNAVMTSLYGSTRQPKIIFGEDTPELKAFYEAMQEVCPGAWTLLKILLNSWQEDALAHGWELPDGFIARCKVMDLEETRVEIDELNHATFTYQYQVNRPVPRGHQKSKSNAANVVHSIDAYIVRSMHRRCNYDLDVVQEADSLLSICHTGRALCGNFEPHPVLDEEIQAYIDRYNRHGIADARILPLLTPGKVLMLPKDMSLALMRITGTMLLHEPFELVTIHDEFKCHPNHMNQLRRHYVQILCELADSTVLDSILTNIYSSEVKVSKLSPDLSKYIKSANYALC